MGAGPFSSDSKSKVNSAQVTGPVTASQGTAQEILQGGKSKNVSQGGINLDSGANVGGPSLGNAKISGSSTVTISNTTTDNGSLALASDLIQKAVTSQADTTAAALGSLGKLSETRETGGGNVIASVASKGILAAAAIVAAIALVLILRRKG
jgi:hypothetical protein